MASKDAEEPCNTGTDEETVALKKKRSRRVSFADVEITSVHIFKRDEDYETPPDSKPSSATTAGDSSGEKSEQEEEKEAFSFLRNFRDEDDKELSPNEDDENDVSARKSFLRPIGSPSPGSSTAGSATSIDEENFFGPVSACFIRPGRLSDSAASDENHDITMDSTAFSMHFRSLARSDSGGDLKTPTHISLGSEDKTPTANASPYGSGSSMVLTRVKKLVFPDPVHAIRASGGRDSNDMSLVGENPRSYDYGRLSPELHALLAEGSKDLDRAIVFGPTNSKSSGGPGDHDVHVDTETSNFANPNISVDTVSAAPQELNGGCATATGDQMTNDLFSHKDNSIVGTPPDYHSPKKLSTSHKSTTDAGGRSKAISKSLQSAKLLDVYGECPALNLLAKHDSVGQICDKEDSLQDRNLSPNKDSSRGSPYRSPLVGLISSLYAKRRQICEDMRETNTMSVTPSPKISGSFLGNITAKRGGDLPSTQKSISEPNNIETSPYGSPRDGIKKSRLKSSHYLSRVSPFKTDAVDNSKDMHLDTMNASISHLEDRSMDVTSLTRGHQITSTTDSNGVETPRNSKRIWTNENEETWDLTNGREPLHNTSVGILRKDKVSESIRVGLSSPFRSAKKVTQPLSMAENAEQDLIALGTESPSTEVMANFEETENSIADKFVVSSVQKLGQQLSDSTDCQVSCSGGLDHKNQAGEISGSGDQEALGDISTSGGHSQMERVTAGAAEPFALSNDSDDVVNFQTASRAISALKLRSVSPVRNFVTGTEPSQSRKEDLRERIDFSSAGSDSSYFHKRNSIGQSTQGVMSPSRKKLTQSPTGIESPWGPSIKNPQNALRGDRMKGCLGNSPKLGSGQQTNADSQERLHVSPSPFPTRIVENSAQKRKSENVFLGGGEHTNKMARTERTLELGKHGNTGLKSILEVSNKDENDKVKTGSKQLTDILPKLSMDVEGLLSQSIDKLDFKSLDVLEETLVNLERIKAIELLCSEIQSQKTFDHVNSIRNRRISDLRAKLCKVVYEKAKLQLMRIKREGLMNKVQKFTSAVQESQLLKLSLQIPGLPPSCTSRGSADNSCCQHEAASDKLSMMKQNIDALEGDVKKITKSICSYFKVNGEPNSLDTIVLANGNLKKRICSRLIQQRLQLWEVDDFDGTKNHHRIILNYNGFISQRITIAVGPNSNLSTSNKLNNVEIVKNFPNMDAYTAFAFVLNAETSKKYTGPRTLMRETQMTNLVLQNLIDVVREVQLAQLEIRSLMQASFLSPSAQQLDLQLCFIDFNSGRQLAVSLDMTCLNRGIYPSEVVPYQLHDHRAGKQNLLPQSAYAKLTTAFEGLRVGYSRIFRLCRFYNGHCGTSRVPESTPARNLVE